MRGPASRWGSGFPNQQVHSSLTASLPRTYLLSARSHHLQPPYNPSSSTTKITLFPIFGISLRDFCLDTEGPNSAFCTNSISAPTSQHHLAFSCVPGSLTTHLFSSTPRTSRHNCGSSTCEIENLECLTTSPNLDNGGDGWRRGGVIAG